MSDDGHGDGGDIELPHLVLKQLDQICDRFEARWQAGESPILEDYLGGVDGSARSFLARDLLLLELDYRQRRGEPITVEALVEERPGLREELGGELCEVADTFGSIIRDTGRSNHDSSCGAGRVLCIRCPHCQECIETSAETPFTSVVCSLCGSRFTLAGGERVTGDSPEATPLSRFALCERLGTGAFGTVWRARDTKLDRSVAVKIPRRGYLDAKDVEQFFREARAAAQLNHPNIVSVHEIGRDGDTVYIVTDLIQGVALSKWMKTQPISVRKAAEMCMKLARAAHHAHESGVIHRDLKPANVMIGADGEPYITDFGLARRELGEVTVTMDGQVLGTPAYMSPEQAMGEGHRADRRTDIYSLGVILYELLTDERPFRGNAGMMIQKVIHTDAPSPRRLNKHIPPDLEAICLRCLEKSARRRYSTASELADDLQRFLRGRPTTARPITTRRRFWRWCMRNPGIACLSTAVCFVLLLGTVTSTYFAVQMNARAVEAAKNAQDALANETAAIRSQYDSYVSLARAHQSSRQPGQRLDCLGACARAAELTSRLGLTSADMRDLRNVAIAGMAMSDLRLTTSWPVPAQYPFFDGCLSQMAWISDGQQRSLMLRRLDDDGDEARILGAASWNCRFSRDGRFLAAKCPTGPLRNLVLRIWRLTDGKLTFQRELGMGGWESFEFSSDGQCLAFGQPDGWIHLYDPETADEIHQFSTGMKRPALAFQPGTHRLAIVGDESSDVFLFDLKDKTVSRRFEHPSPTYRVAWHPLGELLAVACADFNIYVWNSDADEQIGVLRGHENRIMEIGFSSTGELLASRSWDRTSRIWSPQEGRQVFRLNNATFRAFHVAEPQMAATFQQGNEWKAGIWDVGLSRVFKQFYVNREAAREVWSVALDRNAELLAAATFDGVTIWEVSTGKRIGHVAEGIRTWNVLFTPEEGSLIVTSQRGLEMWARGHTPEGRTHFRRTQLPVKATGSAPHVAALSGDGRFLASIVSSEQAVLLDLHRGTTKHLQGKPATDRVAVSQHGHWVAAGLPPEDCVRIWNGRTGDIVGDLPADWPAATFSPNDKWLVISSPEKYQFWDLETWRPGPAIANMQLTCAPLAFSPDGSMLAIAKERWSVNLIEPSSGRELAVLSSPESLDTVGGLSFSGDGRFLAALAKGRRHVKVWNLGLIREQLDQMGLDW